jgi:hypothetical protein
MPIVKSKMGEAVQASVGVSSEEFSRVGLGGVFTVTCFDKDGNLKWEDKFHNLVMNVGLQDLNNKYFNGSAYTAAWYLGLITGPGSGTSFAAADTMSSHTGWTEFINYTGTDRILADFGTATNADPSVILNSTGTGGSPAVYTISGAGGTIAGAFLTTGQVKSATTGILFSAGDFSGGDKIVASGDTVNVTYTFNADATP